MKLAQLIDLEVQLLRDERALADGEGVKINTRDQAIGHRVAEELGLEESTARRHLSSDRGLRHRVCQGWLDLLPTAEQERLPGARIESGYRLAGWVLLVVFILGGIGTAGAALSSGTSTPVNVLVFIVIFFLLQILLLLLYPVFMVWRHVRGGGVLPWLQHLVVRLSRIRFIDRLLGASSSELPETFAQLRLRQTIYGGVQQWLLFTLVQRMATGFNLAALATSFYMVTFHDLAFCWSTTLEIGTGDLQRGLEWIAKPWAWLEVGVLTPDAITVSRYVPADGGYVDSAGITGAVELRRTWWPFLVAGLITWGLLPRALAWSVGTYCARRSRYRVPLNHMAAQHLYERLFPPTASWSGPDPAQVRGEVPAIATDAPASKPAPLASGACDVVCWGTLSSDKTAVGNHLEERFACEVGKVLAAGLADIGVDRKTVSSLARRKPRRVVVTLPEGQQPTVEVMRFLRELRGELGAQCELVVGLLAAASTGFGDVDPDELDSWRRYLLAESDPYLSLQTMGIGS